MVAFICVETAFAISISTLNHDPPCIVKIVSVKIMGVEEIHPDDLVLLVETDVKIDHDTENAEKNEVETAHEKFIQARNNECWIAFASFMDIISTVICPIAFVVMIIVLFRQLN